MRATTHTCIVSTQESYRVLMEGYSYKMWEWYTGVITWKSQGPWPSLRGHHYDYHLEQNGAFWGIRKGLETVHAQVNILGRDNTDWQLGAINTGRGRISLAALTATFFDVDGREVERVSHQIGGIAPSSTYAGEMILWPEALRTDAVAFLRVELSGELLQPGSQQPEPNGVLSRNMYWKTAPGATESNYATALAYMKANPAQVNVTAVEAHTADMLVWEVVVVAVARPAFYLELSLRQDVGGEAVLPTFYTDNHLTLMPGERAVIRMECARGDAQTASPVLRVGGVNVVPFFVQ